MTGSIAERSRIRPASASVIAGDPDPAQLAALDALLGVSDPPRDLVVIPTPEQRARLSEVHIVVFADDDGT